jgi:hypothetical protein
VVWFGDVVSVGAERESSEGALLTVVEKKGRISQLLFVNKKNVHNIVFLCPFHGGIIEEENKAFTEMSSLNI